MRNMGMFILIAVIVIIPSVVSAEMWTAHTTLEKEKSTSARCGEVAISYTLNLTDKTFTATSEYGKMFSITVPADGVIKQTYKRPGGTGWWRLEMTGNVRSRELEIFVDNWHCYYKLTPD
jgi:hypothetical protein